MSTDGDIDPRLAPAIVHRILVVEDDPDTAAFLKTLLASARMESMSASITSPPQGRGDGTARRSAA